MKYMFASDVHGSAYYCRKMLDAYKEEKAERLVLLGDLLYHGPRNDLPREYAPKQVISMLNDMKKEIYAVRGNCEAEVDQMVLQFPVMADYCILNLDGRPFMPHMGIFTMKIICLQSRKRYSDPWTYPCTESRAERRLCTSQTRVLFPFQKKETRLHMRSLRTVCLQLRILREILLRA